MNRFRDSVTGADVSSAAPKIEAAEKPMPRAWRDSIRRDRVMKKHESRGGLARVLCCGPRTASAAVSPSAADEAVLPDRGTPVQVVVGVRLPLDACAGDLVRYDARSVGAAAPVTFAFPADAVPGSVVPLATTVYRAS